MTATPGNQVTAEWADLVNRGFFDEYTYEARRRYQKSSNSLPKDKSAWIVEVGCGTGRYHALLKALGYENILSCDLTLPHLLRAREISPAGNFVVASGQNLPFKDGTFDVLVTNAAIEHFADPLQGVLEFARVTNQMATVVVTSDCYSWRILQLLKLYRSRMPIDRTMSYSRFRSLFKKAGLRICRADAWGITHYLRMASKVSAQFPRLYEAATRDDHWSNIRTTSDLALRLRMLALDENLFVLQKHGTAQHEGPTRRGELTLQDVLMCLHCRGNVLIEREFVKCLQCGTEYQVVDGIPVLQ